MHPNASTTQPGSLPEDWRGVKRILAVRLDNIGDVIMLGPALRTVKHSLPEAEITLMASPAGSQATALLPWVGDVIVWRAVWQDTTGALPLDPSRELGLVETLRNRRFDAAIIFTSFSQSPYPPAYACYLAGIPLRLGHSKEFGGGILTQWVYPPPDEGHQAERNLSLVENAGFHSAGNHLELCIPEEAQTRADQILVQAGLNLETPFIVLAPGASAAARRYDPVRYAMVAKLLADQAGLPVVIVGSQRDEKNIQPVLESVEGKIISLVGQTSIPELAAIIRRSSLVVANNSASLHIADAFLVPMLILYSGSERESQWAPLYSRAHLLRRPTDCSPCHQFRCPYGMECLDIPPADVVKEAVHLLAGMKYPA